MDGGKHKDMDPLAMRALFGKKLSLCEISNVMEREDMEKAYREGWLKHVLEEGDDYDMLELIDPDEYEESMPDLVNSEDDVEMAGRVGSDGDGGTVPVLLGPGEDTSSDRSDEVASLEGLWSGKGAEHGHSTAQSSFEEIDKTMETRVIAKCKAAFDRSHIAELHDKSFISTEDPPYYDGTEASRSNTKLIKDKTAVITKNNPLGECAGVVNDPDKLPKILPYTGRIRW